MGRSKPNTYVDPNEPIPTRGEVSLCEGTPHKIFYLQLCTTLNNGYLGSRNDEERSEMRYVMRIAEFSESSNL